ncbi:hypothetical protein M407DRAFT_245759 [Tulasnella calospora MUT 4182]|uniref:Large ribosomal subunit protein uL3m n=1 Tax=Tulasnella calospora MUT 4182 TaxID=1051891 RepID=A0A0C3Q9E2_9AGAM|nr:hypothetical protein M407DRAFT_245759 [Tulasnella calospora MUT 4182]
MLVLVSEYAGVASMIRQARRGHQAVFKAFASTSASPSDASGSTTWTPQSRRTGLIARKRGMTSIFDPNGAKVPVTVLQVEACQVTANVETPRPAPLPTYYAVQLAASNKREKNVTKQMLGHFAKAGVEPKRIVKEFSVTKDGLLPVGTELSAMHFVPGQFVDVVAKSLGKGFAGTMKRWNFKGLRASHGVSVSHRSAGSTGQHQDPGRVFKGKKMAGRLGGERTTVQNLLVMRVDTGLNLIYVKGAVPGADDADVLISDAKKKVLSMAESKAKKGLTGPDLLPGPVQSLPFPAGTKEMEQTLGAVAIDAPAWGRNPFTPREQ